MGPETEVSLKEHGTREYGTPRKDMEPVVCSIMGWR